MRSLRETSYAFALTIVIIRVTWGQGQISYRPPLKPVSVLYSPVPAPDPAPVPNNSPVPSAPYVSRSPPILVAPYVPSAPYPTERQYASSPSPLVGTPGSPIVRKIKFPYVPNPYPVPPPSPPPPPPPPPSQMYPLYIEEEEEEEDGDHYPIKGSEVVDHKGKYLLEWKVNYKRKVIIFNMTVQTTGWVGLGFSRKGEMKEADIVVAGVKAEEGVPYLQDMFSDYTRRLYMDNDQHWTLLHAREENETTFISIARLLDTCDPYDIPITEDLVHVLWAYGENDYLEYHFDKRGSFREYLLEPFLETKESVELWRISKETTIRPRKTSYWCSIHRGPVLTEKHHIVASTVFLENQLAVNHVHHIIVWRCVPPPGVPADEIFEPLVLYEGEECYFNDNHLIPVLLCKLFIGGWAIGGELSKHPYSTGIAIGDSPTEYYMLEMHYNNPEELEMTINAGLDLFYTSELRENDGGVFFVGNDIFGLFIVPPISQYFDILGMCTPDCTTSMFPEEGVEIVKVALHSHMSGIKMKLHHFRDGKELPWIIKDDNYDNTFQQAHTLYEPRLLLPGDQLVTRCTYDSTWTNITVVSGFATFEEMCLSILYVNKRIPYVVCMSQVPGKEFLPLIGVEDYRWDTECQCRVITEPAELKDVPLSFVLDEVVDWNKKLRYKYQEIFLESTHWGTCPQILVPDDGQVLEGNVIESVPETAEALVEVGKTFGTMTLMGTTEGLPTRTPGPESFAEYPKDAIKYEKARVCPKPYSPFGY